MLKKKNWRRVQPPSTIHNAHTITELQIITCSDQQEARIRSHICQQPTSLKIFSRFNLVPRVFSTFSNSKWRIGQGAGDEVAVAPKADYLFTLCLFG